MSRPASAIDRHRRAARLAHDDGRLQILREEQVLRPRKPPAGVRAKHRGASGKFWRDNASVPSLSGRKSSRARARPDCDLSEADDAIAGAAQRRINAQNESCVTGGGVTGGGQRKSAPRAPACRQDVSSSARIVAGKFPRARVCQRRRGCKSKNAARNFSGRRWENGFFGLNQCPGQF